VRPVSEPTSRAPTGGSVLRWAAIAIEITEARPAVAITSAIKLGQGLRVAAGGDFRHQPRPQRACSSIWDATALASTSGHAPTPAADSSTTCFDAQNRGHGLSLELLCPE